MNDFKIPQVSTLLGSTLANYIKVLKGNRIEPKFYVKILLTTLLVLIATPFHWWEALRFRRKLKRLRFKKPPLFIIGHWRSGTTLLHNVLCEAPSAGYLTTYHATFPNNLSSKWLFKTFMKANMPGKRPSDNIKLDVDYPQEDEFALNNTDPNAFYSFFYFPLEHQYFYEKAVAQKNMSEKEKERWSCAYDKLLKKACINTGAEQLIIKNPVNTARIKTLLSLYPEAKFLYIYRNPITVFLSTQRFYHKLFPSLWLHRVEKSFIDTIIFETYDKLMHDYQEQKKLIPQANLLELEFEKFEQDPMSELERIYKDLLHEDFNEVKSHFGNYLKSIKGYAKNRYAVKRSTIDTVCAKWQYFMRLYNYSTPEDIDVIND